MDTDQAGEDSELQVRKCEGRHNDASKKRTEGKEGSVYFFSTKEMQGEKYGGSEFQRKSSKRRWAGRKRKERVQREERRQCEEQ